MIQIIILLTLFITSFPVSAQEFTTYKENPVLSVGGGLYQPSLLKEQNGYSVWFTEGKDGHAVISRMRSANGIDWYDKKTLSLSASKNNHDSFMFQNNEQYDLYFASSNLDYSDMSLWKATSTDGVTFVSGSEKRIVSPALPWEGGAVSSPSVIQDSGVTYLFYAGNGNDWGVGLATSADGETWQKCGNGAIVPNASGPHIVKFNSIFYLFFHTTAGTLGFKKTSVLDGCNTIWSGNNQLPFSFNDPSAIVVDSNMWLYGTAQSSAGSSLFLAGGAPISPPSYPIVLIPGMFASWNKDALLHNASVDSSTWKLNPNISEYDAIIATLENKGRIRNKDLYIFPYDWRKSITETTQNLSSFLNTSIWNMNPYQPIQIIGHSLGGVVARIYSDQNPTKPIKKSVSAEAPLLGAVQAYKPLSTGEIDRENTLIWMAEKLIVLLNKSGLQSDKETITQKLPVLYDILPAFSFLKNESGGEVLSTLTNSLYSQYPINSSPPVSQLYIGGTGRQVLAGYTIGSYDGRSISSWTEDGDGVVLGKSMRNQIVPAPTQNHGEIIYEKENIKTILSKLNVPVQDGDIPPGKATSIFPAILTFLQSPATMQIIHNGIATSESEGMIHIQNAENGTYALEVTGQTSGEYMLSVWLIGESDDKWFQFKKTAKNGGIDTYQISFEGTTGGTAKEYVAPTSTPAPTLKPTAKPTYKPEPTRRPSPTKKPTPTPKSHSNEEWKDKKEKVFEKIWKEFFKRCWQFWQLRRLPRLAH